MHRKSERQVRTVHKRSSLSSINESRREAVFERLHLTPTPVPAVHPWYLSESQPGFLGVSVIHSAIVGESHL